MFTKSITRYWCGGCRVLDIESFIEDYQLSILATTGVFNDIQNGLLFGSFNPVYINGEELLSSKITHTIDKIYANQNISIVKTTVRIIDTFYGDPDNELIETINNELGSLELNFRIQKYNNKVLSADLYKKCYLQP